MMCTGDAGQRFSKWWCSTPFSTSCSSPLKPYRCAVTGYKGTIILHDSTKWLYGKEKKTEKLKSTELSILGRTQLLLFTLQSIKSDSKSFDVVATVSNYKSFNTLAKQCRNAVCLGSKPPCLDMRPL